ncbi:MAG TPA: HlyC/CorC family transporter [Gammaproteobacteria bacterium]|nr:HlyC/CorC family transporter [Gammaproteobacteria bacterium]
MEYIPLQSLLIILATLLLLSACFAGSETAMMALNRYRLRHLTTQKNSGAIKAQQLLERPDRLIGLLLVGNTFTNFAVSQVATFIGLSLFHGSKHQTEGVAALGFAVGTILLIVSEVMPKTIAALYPERVALPAAHVLQPLLNVTYPLIWLFNVIANALLRLLGIRTEKGEEMALSREELRTVVKEAGAIIPRQHQNMLFAILDLEKGKVEDIMVPRNEISGIDLDASPGDLVDQLAGSHHVRIPVYRGSIDHIVGVLHVRRLPRLLADDRRVTVEEIESAMDEPYYVPVGTPLHKQLLNFQHHRERVGLVVDEYGDLQGLVTLEDLLEEIVGEFTTDALSFSRDIFPQEDGSYLVDGSTSLREINRVLKWKLPTHGARTLNGLILEMLESIPEPGTGLRIAGYTIEIVQTSEQAVKTARLRAKPASAATRAPAGGDGAA